MASTENTAKAGQACSSDRDLEVECSQDHTLCISPKEGGKTVAKTYVAIVGAGPSTLYLLKEMVTRVEVETKPQIDVVIFESTAQLLGAGMPYSREWTGDEHMSNLSCSEIPQLIQPSWEWLREQSDEWLEARGIQRSAISQDYVVTRVLLGEYLSFQFRDVVRIGQSRGMEINVYSQHRVVDIDYLPEVRKFRIDYISSDQAVDARQETKSMMLDKVVVATGHSWQQNKERSISNYFDSPWPITKLKGLPSAEVGILGSSLSAVDATITLALENGSFVRGENEVITYHPKPNTEGFRIVMHSRHGILPSIRSFYTASSFSDHRMISRDEIKQHMAENDGYLSLAMMFEVAYKRPLRKSDPQFAAIIEHDTVEQFVDRVYKEWKAQSNFELFQSDYCTAERSHEDHKSIAWRDYLESMIYTTNLYARYLSGQDMMKFREILMPLASVIEASLPKESAERILALHNARKLMVETVGDSLRIETVPTRPGALVTFTDPAGTEYIRHYPIFINCAGQQQVPIQEFPFPSLVEHGFVVSAVLACRVADGNEDIQKHVAEKNGKSRFVQRNGAWYYDTHAIALDDLFHPIDRSGRSNPNITIIALPFIAGLYPDHSGLQFCSTVASIIAANIVGKGVKGGAPYYNLNDK